MFKLALTCTITLFLGLLLSQTVNAKRLAAPSESEPDIASSSQTDDESDLWAEVKKGGTRDDYQAYLDQYPKGIYSALAKSRIKKLQNEADSEAIRLEKVLWEAADKTGTEEAYQDYLARYPSGLFAALVPARLVKIRIETKLREEDAQWQRAIGTATREAVQAYLENYPKGRYVKEARQKSEEYQRVPARPQLPFTVGENVWRTIEASAAYRNLPKPRTIKIRYQTDDQIEYTGAKSSSLPRPAGTSKSVTKEITPLGGKCSKHRYSYTFSQNNKTVSSDIYMCGNIPLGSISNGKPATVIKSLEVQGSLFPLSIDAEQSDRAANSYIADSKYDSTQTYKCRVTGKGPASDVHPKLTGIAWTLGCEMNFKMAGAQTPMNRTSFMEDYFLEDLGVFLSQIGELDSAKKRFVLPAPGYQTTIVAEGDYGSRNTSTFQSYDWTVN